VRYTKKEKNKKNKPISRLSGIFPYATVKDPSS